MYKLFFLEGGNFGFKGDCADMIATRNIQILQRACKVACMGLLLYTVWTDKVAIGDIRPVVFVIRDTTDMQTAWVT